MVLLARDRTRGETPVCVCVCGSMGEVGFGFGWVDGRTGGQGPWCACRRHPPSTHLIGRHPRSRLTCLVGAAVRGQAHLNGQRVEGRSARVGDLDARGQLVPRSDGLGGRLARERDGAGRGVAAIQRDDRGRIVARRGRIEPPGRGRRPVRVCVFVCVCVCSLSRQVHKPCVCTGCSPTACTYRDASAARGTTSASRTAVPIRAAQRSCIVG